MPNDVPFFPRACARCHADLRVEAYAMSYFNTDVVCMGCLADEKAAPGYADARRIEEEHVLAGDTRFEGVGLSVTDIAFLVQRLDARGKVWARS